MWAFSTPAPSCHCPLWLLPWRTALLWRNFPENPKVATRSQFPWHWVLRGQGLRRPLTWLGGRRWKQTGRIVQVWSLILFYFCWHFLGKKRALLCMRRFISGPHDWGSFHHITPEVLWAPWNLPLLKMVWDYGSDLQTLKDQASWVLKTFHDLDPR